MADLPILSRGTPEYDQVLSSSMFSRRLPDERPAMFVRARDADEVATAVRHARDRDLPISVRSGGHNWSGSHVRDNAVVIDVGGLQDVTIDSDALTATAGPGVGGSDLAVALAEQNLFFPAGHCRGVRLGGYLLQGGYGWNSRAVGPACMSVTGVDVVLADGSSVYADAVHEPDLFWAARGGGAGFFGIVTRFHLQLRPFPGAFGNALYLFGMDVLDDLYGWAYDVRFDVPESIELMLLMSRHLPGPETPGVVLTAPVFATDDDRAQRDLSVLDSCPVLDRALAAAPYVPMTLDVAYDGVMTNYPDAHRWGVDNMWTSGPGDALVTAMSSVAADLPPAPSHALWMNWCPPDDRPDMAYSIEDDIYIALYGSWTDASDDARYQHWARDHMRDLEPLATGIQLADENLRQRPAPFLSTAHFARWDSIRDHYDPDSRFVGWLSRPASEGSPR